MIDMACYRSKSLISSSRLIFHGNNASMSVTDVAAGNALNRRRKYAYEELGNVSQACKIMGVSRDTFYRYQEAKTQGGIEVLLHKDRRRPNLKNRIDEGLSKPCWRMSSSNRRMGKCA
jgi:hypothetical protein